jgi:protein O-GlcNAc transferase
MIEQYRALHDLSPQEPEYVYQLGRAYTKLAAWCYQQIARLDPQSARAYETLAENYRAQGQLELAIRAFQRAGHADPKLPGIHLTLAQIYLEQGKASDARKEIEQELAIVPESVAARSLEEKIALRESQH